VHGFGDKGVAALLAFAADERNRALVTGLLQEVSVTDVKITAPAAAGAGADGKKKKASTKKAAAKQAAVGEEAADGGGAGPLAGETVVFTGKLSGGLSRAAAEDVVRALGGATKTSMTAAVTVLVAETGGGRESSKMKAARENGVKVWDEAEFLALVRTHRPDLLPPVHGQKTEKGP
jgi:DNA ligase (NAD+)